MYDSTARHGFGMTIVMSPDADYAALGKKSSRTNESLKKSR